MNRHKNLFTAMAVIATCNLMALGANPEVEKILAASPGSTGTMSHFPVPFIYAEWEAPVVKRYGRMSLAKFNQRLYEDLPPFKAENQPVPVNSELAPLMEKDKSAATELALQALASYAYKPVWSVIAATERIRCEKFVQPLITIAHNDPNATDRAFALKELAQYRNALALEQLHESLFDDSQSVRMLVVELLSVRGDQSGDPAILSSDRLLNPFRMFFMENALKRIFPDGSVQPSTFFNMELPDQIKLVRKKAPELLDQFLQLAEKYKEKPLASLTLFSMGTDEQAQSALKVLSAELVKQGKQPDRFHGSSFYVRSSIISCLQEATGAKYQMIEQLFLQQSSSYSPDRDIILLALAYSLNHSTDPSVLEKLAAIRNIKTDNYDLYVGAAEALTNSHSKEAFPSLLHILSLKREPFCTVATRDLKKLTGLSTPGTPEDLGMLHNLGVPEGNLDIDKALKFWTDWWQHHKDSLTYDKTTGKFR